MSDKKKVVTNSEENVKDKDKELNLDELDNVSGGTLKDARYTETTCISKRTKENI